MAGKKGTLTLRVSATFEQGLSVMTGLWYFSTCFGVWCGVINLETFTGESVIENERVVITNTI